jgi:toxin ParE1/3/4
MKLKLFISTSARAELKEIIYKLKQLSRPFATKLELQFRQRFQQLLTIPLLGRDRSDLLKGLRSIVVGDYVVFYVPTDDAIEISRIIHGSRNIPELIKRNLPQ